MDSSRTSLLRDRSVYRSSEGEVAEMSTPQTYVPRHLVYNGRRPMTKENGYRNRGGITTKSAYSKGLQPNRETQDDTGGRFTHYIEAHRIETVYTAGSSSPDFRRHLESKAKGDHGGKDVEKEAEEVAPEQATKDKGSGIRCSFEAITFFPLFPPPLLLLHLHPPFVHQNSAPGNPNLAGLRRYQSLKFPPITPMPGIPLTKLHSPRIIHRQWGNNTSEDTGI